MPTGYATAGDNQGTRDPNILKLEDSNRVRPLDNLVAAWRQHGIQNPNDPQQFQSVVCPGPRSCPLCRKPVDPSKPENENRRFPISRRFAANVWDYKSGSVKVLVAGPQVFDDFRTNAQAGIDLTACDWQITKTGQGRNTEYKVVRMNDSDGPKVTPEMLHDVAKYESPTSAEKIFDVLEKYGIDYDSLAVPAFNEQEALAFVMPYTQHKGLTVEKLLATDQQFAEWMHEQKLEQGQFGDPVFVALQVALEARDIVPPLEDALAAVPDPTHAEASSPTEAPSASIDQPLPKSDSVSEPKEGEVRMIAPNGEAINVPQGQVATLEPMGFKVPEPEPDPAEQEIQAQEEPVMMEVEIGGNKVTLPLADAEQLLASGVASLTEAVPLPTLPANDEVVEIAIAGNPVPMAFGQAKPLIESETAVFTDPLMQVTFMTSLQKQQDKADQASVREQAEAEQASPAAQPETEDGMKSCPYCGHQVKSKGGMSNHIKKTHPAEYAASKGAEPQAAAAPAATAAPTNGGTAASSDEHAALVEKVKNKIASSSFGKDYTKILDIFDKETGKRNVMEMSDEQLRAVEARIDAESAAA